MSLDIEHELRTAMQEATADLQAPPDLLGRLRSQPRRAPSRPAWRVAVAAAAVVAVAAGALVATRHLGGRDSFDVADAISSWGPARGDLAHDPATLRQIDAEWAHPAGRQADIAGFDPVPGDRPPQVLWAGRTPAGSAAYVVQHLHSAHADWAYGVLLPDAHGVLRLYYRLELDPTDSGAAWQPQPQGFSFAASRALHAFVVVPTDPRATIEVSTRHSTDAQGHATPQWADVVSTDGAGVVSIPAGASMWDTVIRIDDGARPPAASGVNLIPSKDGPPQPANALGLWCNACNVTGGSDLGTGEQPWRAWTSRYAPAWYPTFQAIWTVGGTLHGHEVLATQLWLPGERAHTIVGYDDGGGVFKRIVYDEVTDASARPLLAVRLPDGDGWLVGAGPGTTVSGWREVGAGAWHDVAAKKAVLLTTNVASIQLRLSVGGKERIVTRSAG
jgi:hypothetical protein